MDRGGEPAHVPALDGIRGLGIVLVMLFHMNQLLLRTRIDRAFVLLAEFGWIGVDLFFVLSGFLITGILLDAKGSAHYFRNFYVRRVLRIFPLYYAVLVISLFVLPHLLPPDKALRFGSIAGDELYYWLYLSNFSTAWAGQPRHGVLDVTWSLSIEEQFYLVWPVVVLLCTRPALKRIAVALMGLSLVVRIGLQLTTDLNAFSIYVLTPCHLDAIAMGALIAVLAREPLGLAPLARPARLGAFLVGFAALALALIEAVLRPNVFGTGFSPIFNTFGFTLIAVAFGGLLISVLTAAPRSLLSRVFTSGLLRTFGKYSYGLYLIHLPLRAVIRDRLFGPSNRAPRFFFPVLFGSELPGQLLFYALAGAASLAAAWLSFHLFEKQFLKLKRFFPTGAPSPREAGFAGAAPASSADAAEEPRRAG
jgi:peptidoglycan/LPS O-acetylase OafA/YrhL